MPRIFKQLEAGCLQVNLMSTCAQMNQLKYTILYYTKFLTRHVSTSTSRIICSEIWCQLIIYILLSVANKSYYSYFFLVVFINCKLSL